MIRAIADKLVRGRRAGLEGPGLPVRGHGRHRRGLQRLPGRPPPRGGRPAAPAEAVAVAVERTGGIICSAGVIMAATLGSLMAGEISLLRQLGPAPAMGMLIDAMVFYPLVLPAFAVVTGRVGRRTRR